MKTKYFAAAMTKMTVITSLLVTVVPCAWAATNLNSSRSNIYKVTNDPAASPAEVAKILKVLGSLGSDLDEAAVKQALRQQGINLAHIKNITLLTDDNTHKETQILFSASDGSQ